MQIIELPLKCIRYPDWNSNQMDAAMFDRLRSSIERFGPVVPLAVRNVGPAIYETVGGKWRADALREMGFDSVLCVEVFADDNEARLLAQAQKNIVGTEDLGLRAETLRSILDSVSQEEVLALLPEAAESLGELVSLGEEDLPRHLQAWNLAQSAQLKHLTFQLAADQLAGGKSRPGALNDACVDRCGWGSQPQSPRQRSLPPVPNLSGTRRRVYACV